MLLEKLTVKELKYAIATYHLGLPPVGGYPVEWYEEELKRRSTG